MRSHCSRKKCERKISIFYGGVGAKDEMRKNRRGCLENRRGTGRLTRWKKIGDTIFSFFFFFFPLFLRLGRNNATRRRNGADRVKEENERREFSLAEVNSTREVSLSLPRGRGFLLWETHEIINEPFRRSRLCTNSRRERDFKRETTPLTAAFPSKLAVESNNSPENLGINSREIGPTTSVASIKPPRSTHFSFFASLLRQHNAIRDACEDPVAAKR